MTDISWSRGSPHSLISTQAKGLIGKNVWGKSWVIISIQTIVILVFMIIIIIPCLYRVWHQLKPFNWENVHLFDFCTFLGGKYSAFPVIFILYSYLPSSWWCLLWCSCDLYISLMGNKTQTHFRQRSVNVLPLFRVNSHCSSTLFRLLISHFCSQQFYFSNQHLHAFAKKCIFFYSWQIEIESLIKQSGKDLATFFSIRVHSGI